MRKAGWGGRGTLDRGFVAGTIRCAFARQRKPHDEPWSCGTNPRIRARSTVVHASCRPHWAPIYPKCHLPRRDGLTCLSLDITDIRARLIHHGAESRLQISARALISIILLVVIKLDAPVTTCHAAKHGNFWDSAGHQAAYVGRVGLEYRMSGRSILTVMVYALVRC